MSFLKRINWTSILLWGIYLALLGVLLPHTAWAFYQVEPENQFGWIIAWAAAVFFEATIAALTFKQSQIISSRKKLSKKLLNPYVAGLLLSLGVSAYANLSHAFQFGRAIKIFGGQSWPFILYTISFGAILPVASFIFAWILSEEDLAEHITSPELQRAKETIKELKKEVGAAYQAKDEVNMLLEEEREKENVLGNLSGLFYGNKKEKIQIAVELWPEQTYEFYSKVTGASIGYISEVLTK